MHRMALLFKIYNFWPQQIQFSIKIFGNKINVVGVEGLHVTRAPHADANAWLQLLLENSKSKRGHNYIKINLRTTSPTGMGSPFDSKQLFWVSSKYLQ